MWWIGSLCFRLFCDSLVLLSTCWAAYWWNWAGGGMWRTIWPSYPWATGVRAMSTAKEELQRLVETLDEEQAKRLLRLTKRMRIGPRQDRNWPGSSLLRLAGAFEGPPDLSERHDYYVAREREQV